jgi:flagellin
LCLPETVNSAPGAFDALMQAGAKPRGAGQFALQTRQQLSVTALSLADQASHALLMVF